MKLYDNLRASCVCRLVHLFLVFPFCRYTHNNIQNCTILSITAFAQIWLEKVNFVFLPSASKSETSSDFCVPEGLYQLFSIFDLFGLKIYIYFACLPYNRNNWIIIGKTKCFLGLGESFAHGETCATACNCSSESGRQGGG